MTTELNLQTSPIDPGLTVIEASAGTGKTYSISHLVPRLLLEGTLPDLAKLLLVTFTKDAARELAERVRQVLTRLAAPATIDEARAAPDIAGLRVYLDDPAAQARLDRALLDLDLLAVSTIHAFCQRSLQQEGTLCGLPVLPEVITDDRDYLEPIVRRHWLDTLSRDGMLAAISTAQGWSLNETIKFINARHRHQSSACEPPVPDFTVLRKRLDQLVNGAAAPTQLAEFRELIGQVPQWNKGVTDSADALAQIEPLVAADANTLEFWDALNVALNLPGRITSRKSAAKELKSRIQTCAWFEGLVQLSAHVTQILWSWQQALADVALPELVEVLAERRLITQDGLIGTLYRALHRPDPGAAQSTRLADRLAERYHVALIDESQDTDPRQFAIFQRVFLEASPCRRLVLIGDPKQAIYGFRGADLSTYLRARAAANRIYTLTRTFRAPQPLVATVNQIFGRPAAFHHADMAFAPAVSGLATDTQLILAGTATSRLECWLPPADLLDSYTSQGRRVPLLCATVASTIVNLLHHGTIRTTGTETGAEPAEKPVTPHDIAVLVATNRQAQLMADALQIRAVPAVVNSGADVFATDEARELLVVLRAITEPRRSRALRSALATRLLGLDATAIATLDTPAEEGAPDSPFTHWLNRFSTWQRLWQERGLAALFSAWEMSDELLAQGVTHRLAREPLVGERRATNYRQLTDLLLEATRDESPRPDELLRWLGHQIARAESQAPEEHQLQLASDRPAVHVVTMHKAKGLEYPLVFCPFLADPLKSTTGYEAAPPPAADIPATLVNIDLLDEEGKAVRALEFTARQLEERLRLTYVALTRAKVRLWTCVYPGGSRAKLGSALDWLLRPADEIAAHPSYSTAWAEHVQSGGLARLAQGLRDLEAAAGDDSLIFLDTPAITLEPYREGSSGQSAADQAPRGNALPAPAIPPAWRITSFSTLTREKHAHGPVVPRDPTPDAATAPATANAAAGPSFLQAGAGAAVGTAVHDWIETWNLGPPDIHALARHLQTTHLPPPCDDQPEWAACLHELFEILRLIRLPGCGTAPLHELCPAAHGSEWHFHLPLAGRLSVNALADCFAAHAAPAHRAYAPQLRALSDETFHGLLQGFIDRLARHGPHWGVIDWKTNRLGPTLADYDEPAMLRCAMDAHYLLQGHLYLVALRRYLRQLGVTDDPIAGAWLVFLRAIAPESERGVLHINPPPAMLDALDALFAPARAEKIAR